MDLLSPLNKRYLHGIFTTGAFMETLYYGIDLHSTQITNHIIKKDEKGELQRSNEKIYTNELDDKLLPKLTKNSYVCVEASSCTYNFVKRIKDHVKQVIVINPIDFKNMYCTNKKTDRVDAKKLANKLKYFIESEDEDENFPEVYMPKEEVNQLRKLFSLYKLSSKNSIDVKNRIHSILRSNFIVYKKDSLFNRIEKVKEHFDKLDEIDVFQINILLDQLKTIEKSIGNIRMKIYEIGFKNFKEEIKLLISIKGISEFSACAIISDIGDINRFKNYKKLCSYLRSAPKVDASNNSIKNGSISKKGRKLTFELILQGLSHIIKSTPKFQEFYDRKSKGKGKNKVRSAIVRKTIVAIYYILKNREVYKDLDIKNYEYKLKQFEKTLNYFSQVA
jgi:transposase